MDNPFPLSLADRNQIRDLNRRVAAVFAQQGTDPKLAFIVLLNVLGSLIGTQMNDLERVDAVAKAQMTLPMYVEAYRVKEIKLDRP